jgi:hypothetical protein
VYDPRRPVPPLGSPFEEGFHTATADGSVTFVKKTISEKTLHLAIIRNDGEPMPPDWDASADRIPPSQVLTMVSGRVVYLGRPVEGGSITFFSWAVGAETRKAMIQRDGTYQLDKGLPPGRYAVLVEQAAGAKIQLPKKYTTVRTTTLDYKISPNRHQVINIDLQD